MEKDPKQPNRFETLLIAIAVLGFIALLAWMQEDDRKSVLRDSCRQTPVMEICSTLRN